MDNLENLENLENVNNTIENVEIDIEDQVETPAETQVENPVTILHDYAAKYAALYAISLDTKFNSQYYSINEKAYFRGAKDAYINALKTMGVFNRQLMIDLVIEHTKFYKDNTAALQEAIRDIR